MVVKRKVYGPDLALGRLKDVGDVVSGMDDVARTLTSGPLQLTEYAEKFGISLRGLDVPKGVGMDLIALYPSVSTQQDERNEIHTICVGLVRYPQDPEPELVITREMDRQDTVDPEFIPAIYSYWEYIDMPEPNFPHGVRAEGYRDVSAWAKYHLVIPKNHEEPYLVINPLQYSEITPKAQQDFEAELRAMIDGGGLKSGERHRLQWCLRNLRSPYLYADRDVALAILGLEVATALGVSTVCTPYTESYAERRDVKIRDINEILRSGTHGIRIVDGIRP